MAEHLRFERFPRKVKLTPEAALRHAEHVLWYRQTRAAARRRLNEVRSSARFSFLQAAE
jgi:hypothetical protein